jgi:anti-anti-sigma factor
MYIRRKANLRGGSTIGVPRLAAHPRSKELAIALITTSEDRDSMTIRFVENKMTMHISTPLFKELEDTLSTPKTTIYMNMEAVDSIDSSIVGVLVRFHKKVKEQGRKLIFKNLTPTMVELFKLTRMNAYLNIQS